jgi:hypothetical protein
MQVRNTTWEVSISSASVVAKRIKEDLLGSHAAQASQESLSAEVMRVSLWAQCAYQHDIPVSDAGISTRRLLKSARAIWRPIAAFHQGNIDWGEELHDNDTEETVRLGRTSLEILAGQGDMLELSGGRWLPAPLRFVSITSKQRLLVGGMPTRLLPPLMQRTLSLHGNFRYVDGAVDTSFTQGTAFHIPWQSLENWLGQTQALEELVRYFEEIELLPVSHQHVFDTSLEAYNASLNTSQYSRWQSLNRLKDGHYLLRSSTSWGINRYTIGTVNNYQLTQQSAELQHTEIRRLCYALDQQAGVPTKARWIQRRNLLVLHSELPGRERKFLSTLGTLIENDNGNYYPRQWVIEGDVTPVFSILNTLGIQIDVEN